MIWAIINFGLAAWFMRDSKICFEEERNGWGWTYLVFSAVNFAAGLNAVF
jgi:hypothetical protein